MQSVNSEMMGRGGKARSLLSCCFAVTKKHMEGLTEPLEHQRGSVLTPPRQTALYLPTPELSQWVGGRAWGRAACALGVPAHSSSDVHEVQYLHFAHWSDVASALSRGSLGGLLGCRQGLPSSSGGRIPVLSQCARSRGESRYWTHSPPQSVITFSRLGSSPQHCPAPFRVVGTPKSVPVHFPREMRLRTSSLLPWLPAAPARSLPVPRRPQSCPSFYLK